MVICLERGADLHMAQLMPQPLTVCYVASVKSRLVLPFWYWLTWIVPEKGPLNGFVLLLLLYYDKYYLVAQLVECLVTSGYPNGSSSGGPGSNPGENENFWKIPRIT